MLRKIILFSAVFLAVCLLASCEFSPDDPLAQSSADTLSDTDVSVLESAADSSFEDVLVIVPDDSQSFDSEESVDASSEDESVNTSAESPAESSEEVSDETSEDTSSEEISNPSFRGGEVKTLVTPEETLLPIRSIVQGEENVLDLFGDVDLSDPELADAIAQIQTQLDSYDKGLAFFAYSLDGSRAITYNCEDNYFSACTIKAGYVLYCCLAIDQGLASKDEVMYYQEKYYHGGSGKIKNSEFGTPYTLEQLIKLSLSVSDNIAYKMLNAYFGIEGYNQMVKTLGVERLRLNTWSVWNNKTTARDLSIIWREIYFYFQTETPMAKLFYRSCTNTAYNYATRYLDETYSHKSGDRFPPNPVCNDAAIVWKDIPYVITVLNASEDEKEDRQVIGTIVKLINDVVMKNNDLPEEE